jgi:predicted outer membrane repeat protein
MFADNLFIKNNATFRGGGAVHFETRMYRKHDGEPLMQTISHSQLLDNTAATNGGGVSVTVSPKPYKTLKMFEKSSTTNPKKPKP